MLCLQSFFLGGGGGYRHVDDVGHMHSAAYDWNVVHFANVFLFLSRFYVF